MTCYWLKIFLNDWLKLLYRSQTINFDVELLVVISRNYFKSDWVEIRPTKVQHINCNQLCSNECGSQLVVKNRDFIYKTILVAPRDRQALCWTFFFQKLLENTEGWHIDWRAPPSIKDVWVTKIVDAKLMIFSITIFYKIK